MNDYWFPFYPSRYKSKTMHLSAEQDGIYRRLIDHYMETKQPLPDNDTALARIAGVSNECFEHASSIVRAFFEHKEGVLYNDTCDDLLEEQHLRSAKRTNIAKRAAKKRWEQHAENKQENASCILHAMHNDATEHNITEHNSKKERKYKKKSLQPEEVSNEVWNDFILQRKTKFTATALKLIQNQAVLAGWTIEEALAEAASRGWQSFKANWVTTKGKINGNGYKTNSDKADDVCEKRLADIRRRKAESDSQDSQRHLQDFR